MATTELTAPRVKPRLRGIFHAAAFALTPVVAFALISEAPSGRALAVALTYAVSLSALFGVSALYHCPMWGPRQLRILRSLDHATIFIFIAATYTPFAETLSGPGRGVILAIAWGGAAVGITRAIFWPRAPRVISVGLYLVLGWAAVPFMGALAAALGSERIVLIVAGGLLYSLGAIVYGRRWPDPAPRVFGFHEIFHLFTLAATALHLVVVASIIAQLR